MRADGLLSKVEVARHMALGSIIFELIEASPNHFSNISKGIL
jgi:hypothetical protein